jgi:hypothetical protein
MDAAKAIFLAAMGVIIVAIIFTSKQTGDIIAGLGNSLSGFANATIKTSGG